MNTTIVSGCSWSNRDYFSRVHPTWDTSQYKKWDELLEHHYGWNIVNLSENALGNQEMIRRATEKTYCENVERIIIPLSQWYRFSTPGGYKFHPNGVIDPMPVHWDNEVTEQRKKDHNKWTKRQTDYFELLPFSDRMQKDLVETTLFEILRLIDLCKYKNIELIIFQMIEPNIKESLIDEVYTNQHFKIISESKNTRLFGWPFFVELGGMSFWNEMNSDMLISEYDGHPNREGHQKIFELFKGYYKNV